MNSVEHDWRAPVGYAPAGEAIADADVARDDGRPKRVFGPPIGGIDGVGVEQKREHGRDLDGQMRGKIAGHAATARPFDRRIELIVEMATGDSRPRDEMAPAR